MKNVSITAVSLFLFSLAPVAIQAADSLPANIQVTIKDEAGSLADNAHVYIFSLDKKEIFGTREVSKGRVLLTLPAGRYRISAACTLKSDGITEHYSSHEADIAVSSADETSLMLPLIKAKDSEFAISDAVRQKLGVEGDLANYLN